MTELEPTEQEIQAAKIPHDIFVSNLITNHILLFVSFSALGGEYIMYLLPIVPLLSVSALIYTFYRSSKVKREESEFVYIHWQIARRWSVLFARVLTLMFTVVILGWLAHHHFGMMREMLYGFIGGIGLLPTLVTVLILIIIESDALHQARVGTIPHWARQKFLGEA